MDAVEAVVAWPIVTYYRIKVWWLGGQVKCMHGVKFRDDCSLCGEGLS